MAEQRQQLLAFPGSGSLVSEHLAACVLQSSGESGHCPTLCGMHGRWDIRDVSRAPQISWLVLNFKEIDDRQFERLFPTEGEGD